MIVSEHIEKHTLHEVGVTPGHGVRDTARFHKSQKRLEADGHGQCCVFGCQNTHIETHHRYEFSYENLCDFDKLKKYLLGHDVYGYSRLMINVPIESVDDERNLVNICKEHHVGVDHEDDGSGIGIHEVTEPAFIVQICCLDGCNPIPQKGETLEMVEDRIAKNSRKE